MSSGERRQPRLTINPFITSSDIISADVSSPFHSQTTVCVLTHKPNAAIVSKRVLNQLPDQQAVEAFSSPLLLVYTRHNAKNKTEACTTVTPVSGLFSSIVPAAAPHSSLFHYIPLTLHLFPSIASFICGPWLQWPGWRRCCLSRLNNAASVSIRRTQATLTRRQT